MESIKFMIDDVEKEAQQMALLDIIEQDYINANNKIIAAMVKNKIVELTYIVNNGDVIKTLDLQTEEGMRVYIRGLIHIFIRACYSVLPNCDVFIENTVASGLYCEIRNTKIDPFIVDKIGRKMREYVNQDEKFEKKLVSKQHAIDFYKSQRQPDKARLIEYREDKQFKMYSCGKLTDYYYGHMPPSTGYVNNFRLFFDGHGIIVGYPNRNDLNAEIVMPNHPKLSFVFAQSKNWAELIGCSYVADLNDAVKGGSLRDIILISEALHEKNISLIADEICESNSKLVLVAGPSSSGKTTFSQRLKIQLMVNGKQPALLSLDNYYIDRDKIAPLEDGSIDLEDISTIDTELFNEHMLALMQGKTVEVPRFNFAKEKREETGKIMSLPDNGVLMVEGIHGLNKTLAKDVDRSLKFKIYISALTQINLDRHNRIPTTDVRLIRRLVRDHAHRGASAEKTLSMWQSVIAGEQKWIFPFQEDCNIMFNSTLLYELLFLKHDAVELLKTVDENSQYFSEANRMIKFLNYFVNIDKKEESDIPSTSILREFIGSGIFEQ